MQVQTYLFGTIEVNPDTVISFPQGLVGFEDSKRFVLIHETDKGEPATYTLQSIDDPNLAFQIVDSSAMGLHYELALTDAETALLQGPAQEDVAVMLLLFKQEDAAPVGVGANVRAPLILNTRARVAIQKVIEKPRSNIIISNLSSPV